MFEIFNLKYFCLGDFEETEELEVAEETALRHQNMMVSTDFFKGEVVAFCIGVGEKTGTNI